jgi:hypothetical protein
MSIFRQSKASCCWSVYSQGVVFFVRWSSGLAIKPMNPRNFCISVGLLDIAQFLMCSIFFGFIFRIPFPTMTPRYSISRFKNLHFSGLRYRSCSCSFLST